MNSEFRMRTPAEYLKIIRRRVWLIVLPAFAIATSVIWVVWHLPNVYESTSLLIVKPSTIPNAIVPALSDVDLSLRISTIGQEVTSRSSLEPLITKYGLYQKERKRGVPMETILEGMRKAIKVEVDKSRNDVTNGFKVAYRGDDPAATQQVTAELASKYVSAQLAATTASSTQTRQFFEHQLAEANKSLDEIEQRRLEYLQQNVRNLPSQTTSLVGQLTGLREAERALITEIGRNQDQRRALSNQITILRKQTEQQITDVAENTTDPKTTIAYAELAKRKADLEAEVNNMLTVYKPKNPDVVAKKAQLESIQREIDKMIDDWKARIEEKKQRLSSRVDLSVANYEENLRLVDGEIARQQGILADTQRQIAEITARINEIPSTEVGLSALNAEYETKKLYRDQLLDKKQKADLSADVAANAQGETIQVIDTANLPQAPVAPKKLLLMPLGAVLGLGVGLLLAGFVEVPRLMRIEGIADARHYTGLPIYAAVPRLLTPVEARRAPVNRRLKLAGAIVLTVAMIPALAFVLTVSRVFERFVS